MEILYRVFKKIWHFTSRPPCYNSLPMTNIYFLGLSLNLDAKVSFQSVPFIEQLNFGRIKTPQFRVTAPPYFGGDRTPARKTQWTRSAGQCTTPAIARWSSGAPSPSATGVQRAGGPAAWPALSRARVRHRGQPGRQLLRLTAAAHLAQQT